jgi:hypothetical protein
MAPACKKWTGGSSAPAEAAARTVAIHTMPATRIRPAAELRSKETIVMDVQLPLDDEKKAVG